MRKLVVISHTEHQINRNGEVVGWGPTINELNHLVGQWEEIVHIACLESKLPTASSIAYNSSIRFVPIPTFGGRNILNKINILWKTPQILYRMNKELRNATHVQVRLPMGIGPFVLLFFKLRKRDFLLWVKYANNWSAKNIPVTNKIQRTLLKKNFLNCKVTINGFWNKQPQHCYSFENPCLEKEDIEIGRLLIEEKKYNVRPVLIYVGGLHKAKGVDILVEFLKSVDSELIEFFHVVGEGEMSVSLSEALKENGVNYKIHGGLAQSELHKLLQLSHFIVLPSRSEGFPKVLAEAMCFGCIPICSEVGSIGHYVMKNRTGFIMEDITAEGLNNSFKESISKDDLELRTMAKLGNETSALFTFDHYLNKLNKTIFN